MSHEQINAAGKVYRDVYGIPAQPCNPGADGGLELFNHFLAVDYNSMHPCAEPCAERVELVMRKNECSFDEALERIKSGTGPGGRGFTRTLVIVEDGQLEYTADVSPERLHDAALLRHQWQHWRYTKPTLNDKGEKEWGPQKMNDDFGNCLSAGTIIRTKRGDLPIEQVRVGDYALTRKGWRPVEVARPTRMAQTFSVALSNGSSLRGTGDHLIWVENYGWKALRDLHYCDKILSCLTPKLSLDQSESISTASRFIAILKRSNERIASTLRRTLPPERTASPTTTLSFGRQLTDLCRMVTKSIIRTATHSTTISQTWSAFQSPITCEGIPWSGTLPKREGKNYERWLTRLMRRAHGTAISADSNMSHTQSVVGPVRCRVAGGCGAVSRLRALFARSVARLWWAEERSQSFAQASVVSEPVIASTELVYNLQVREVPEYFANGVLVHNCAMFLFHDTVPQAAPLNHGELVQEYMPVPLKDETIEAEIDPERAVKLKMAQLMKLKGIEKQLQKRPSRNLVGRYRDLMKRK
jgi:hypothetical protein